MKILVIQNCEIETIGLYELYFIHNKINYNVFHAYKNGRFPSHKNYDGFIVGGTPISINEFHKHTFLESEWQYIKKITELNKPFLGICFGGQLLASALGAEVGKNPVMEIGGYEVQLTSYGRKDGLFKGFPNMFPVFQWHGDTLSFPKGAELLVEGEKCKNQAFRYKKAVALLFHLEITTKDASKWAEKYANELKIVNKTKPRVLEECRVREKEMKKLAYLYLKNFLKSIKNIDIV